MRIYLKNNPVKFHPDPIWNDGRSLWLFGEVAQTGRTTRWVAIINVYCCFDQVCFRLYRGGSNTDGNNCIRAMQLHYGVLIPISMPAVWIWMWLWICIVNIVIVYIVSLYYHVEDPLEASHDERLLPLQSRRTAVLLAIEFLWPNTIQGGP